MTRQKNISISISSLVLSLLLLMPLCATAQSHKKKVKELLTMPLLLFGREIGNHLAVLRIHVCT